MSYRRTTITRRLATATAVGAFAAAMVGTGPATAAAHDIELPAGTACADFALGIDVMGDAPTTRVFTDREGNVTRVITAGKGQALTFTNLVSEGSLSLKANGSVNITRPGANGVSTATLMGHNVIIMFPSDTPPGPSTTLYVGRVVYTFDQFNNFTMLSTTGRSMDICAALAG